MFELYARRFDMNGRKYGNSRKNIPEKICDEIKTQ